MMVETFEGSSKKLKTRFLGWAIQTFRRLDINLVYCYNLGLGCILSQSGHGQDLFFDHGLGQQRAWLGFTLLLK